MEILDRLQTKRVSASLAAWLCWVRRNVISFLISLVPSSPLAIAPSTNPGYSERSRCRAKSRSAYMRPSISRIYRQVPSCSSSLGRLSARVRTLLSLRGVRSLGASPCFLGGRKAFGLGRRESCLCSSGHSGLRGTANWGLGAEGSVTQTGEIFLALVGPSDICCLRPTVPII